MSYASFHAAPSVLGVLLTIDIATRGLDTPDVGGVAIRPAF